ncbi:MAG: hypothetical protein LBM93_12010 [Oscillospiraceae bacterium]|jgi:hypothetical protein|nr:hypothetical protein [Oscillospiraceae bacterium]
MSTNKYYEQIKHFQEKITKYATEIFKVYGNELQLRLEDYNLLTNDKNCLESSTAFGYIIEEFLVSKLEIYSENHTENDYIIKRTDGSTTTSSYDCFSMLGDIKALVNIKADKNNNNAIAAINKLYDDYVLRTPGETKAYLVFKIHYHIGISERDSKRKIFIDSIDSFFLEEIDFSKGHHQDRRSWSAEYKANSGRLQATSAFRREHKVTVKDISYKNTTAMLKNLFDNNC